MFKNKILFITLLLIVIAVLYAVVNISRGKGSYGGSHATEPETAPKAKLQTEYIIYQEKVTQDNEGLSRPKKDNVVFQSVLDDIENGKSVSAERIADALKSIFLNYPKDIHGEVALYALPLFLQLDQNFASCKETVVGLYREKELPDTLRVAMLEIMDRHFDHDLAGVVTDVFMDKDSEDSLMLGKSAKVLAGRNIDISGELMERYPDATDVEKRYYAESLAYLKKKEALPMISEDIERMEDVALQSSLIQSYAKLAPGDSKTISRLVEIADGSSVAKNELKPEILSIQAVVALGRSNTPQAYRELLEVVENEEALPSVRIVAVESFYTLPESMKAEVAVSLQKLSTEIPNSKSLDHIDRERLSTHIKRVLSFLSKE